ncbi:MAG: hypothetical protein ACPGTU_06320 [Myxococcota bacterium]
MVGIPITPLGHLAHALFPLPLIALLLWFAGRRSDPSDAWRTRIDVPLALVSAFSASMISTLWMPKYFMVAHSLTASDFSQYCENLGLFRDDQLGGWIKQRSLVAGWLPGSLASTWGIIDGLFLAAVISHILMGIGLYLWARAIHSRLAGVCAALLACSVAPLVHLTRTVTFYPETVAGYVLSAAGVTLALRYRNLTAILCSTLATGFVLILDVRGLIYALPALSLTLVVVMCQSSWIRRGVGVAIVTVGLFASYHLGRITAWESTPSLEQQTVFYVDEALRRFSPDDPSAGLKITEDSYNSRFIWGETNPLNIPKTLNYLWGVRDSLPDGLKDHPETSYSRRVHVTPWWVPAAFGLCLAVFGARRRKLLAIGLVGSFVPFAFALRSASTMVSHSRYFATGITMVPVLLGVGLAVLYLGPLAERDRKRSHDWYSRGDLLAVGGLLVVVLGLIPTWISPAATWRSPISADVEPAHSLWHSAHSESIPTDVSPACAESLQEDFANGMAVGSSLLSWTVKEAPFHQTPPPPEPPGESVPVGPPEPLAGEPTHLRPDKGKQAQ